MGSGQVIEDLDRQEYEIQQKLKFSEKSVRELLHQLDAIREYRNGLVEAAKKATEVFGHMTAEELEKLGRGIFLLAQRKRNGG